ncbi:MAG: D-2-hydroxyacid dehydrogenase [Acidobacteriota bacterium]
MKNILVDMPLLPSELEALHAIPGVRVQTVEPEERVRSLPSNLVRDAQVLFCTFPPSNLAEMEKLELVQVSTAGYDSLFGLKLAERGIRVANSLGVFDAPIAEWNLAMMVNLARDVRGMIRNQEAARWERLPVHQSELRGSVVGTWGYGGIGRETARLSKALGMTVHVLARHGVRPRRQTYCVPGTGDSEGVLPDHVFLEGQESDFLSSLDFLVLAMPLTGRTRGIVGERELQALPRRAFLLNPARGPLVQEQALLKALRQGWIAGAALDTHYQYPLPPEHPLWSLPNVILTPHISGASHSRRFLGRVWEIFVENVRRFISGQPLWNELSAEQLLDRT